MTNTINVLMIDDDTIVLQALRQFFQAPQYRDIRIAATAGSTQEALELLAQEHEFDVVITDMHIPAVPGGEKYNRYGVDLIRTANRLSNPPFFLAISSRTEDPQFVLGALQAGAKGYVLKGDGADNLVEAIRRVNSGLRVWPPEILDYVVDGGVSISHELEERERVILDMIADDKTDREIADSLGLSPYTVRKSNQEIYRKLGVRSRTGAAIKWDRMRQGRAEE